MEKNKNIKKAKEKLNIMSEDETVRRLAELREKAILDEKSARTASYNEGKNDGFIDGHTKGFNEGFEQKNKENAKKMKEEGIDINTIIKITNLTKEEIEKL